jgi:hypothetical protein
MFLSNFFSKVPKVDNNKCICLNYIDCKVKCIHKKEHLEVDNCTTKKCGWYRKEKPFCVPISTNFNKAVPTSKRNTFLFEES